MGCRCTVRNPRFFYRFNPALALRARISRSGRSRQAPSAPPSPSRTPNRLARHAGYLSRPHCGTLTARLRIPSNPRSIPAHTESAMQMRRLVLTALVTISLAAIAGAAAPSGTRPNILLIVSDDQGYRDLGCSGGSEIKTPHPDRLATQGVRLRGAGGGL